MTRFFRIQQDRLVGTRRTPLDFAEKIEGWPADDLSLIGVDSLVITNQNPACKLYSQETVAFPTEALGVKLRGAA